MTTNTTNSTEHESCCSTDLQCTSDVQCEKPTSVYRPHVDIIESDDAVVLVADVPGADETDTKVTLEKNLLKIHAHAAPHDVEGHALAYSEYGVGDFERVFTVSDSIDRDGIEAQVKDGVLTIRLPKTAQAAPNKIVVNAG